MQKIIPHLWFDKEAREAAALYTSVFPDSEAIHTTLLRNTPSGDCDLVSFRLWHQEFMVISAGPLFPMNPSVSFIVNYDPLLFRSSAHPEQTARESLDQAWEKLMEGGKALMPLDTYPCSKHYGWLQDRYGVSWQLMLTDPSGEPRPPIVPSLMFTGAKVGKAEEALQFYTNWAFDEHLREQRDPGYQATPRLAEIDQALLALERGVPDQAATQGPPRRAA